MAMGWGIVIKLCLALVLGLFCGGWDDRHKTVILYPLVCMGTCLLTLLCIGYQRILGVNLSIIVNQIMTCVGFLGAVMIWRGESIEAGLANAACLWIAAAIGMTIGYAYYLAAIWAAVISHFTILWLRE